MDKELMTLGEIEWYEKDFIMISKDEKRLIATARAAHRLQEEVASLKRCIEMQADTFKTGLEAHKEVGKLKAENEELRKDAERYRWLRNSLWENFKIPEILRTPILSGLDEDFDIVIDAAMKKGGGDTITTWDEPITSETIESFLKKKGGKDE